MLPKTPLNKDFISGLRKNFNDYNVAFIEKMKGKATKLLQLKTQYVKLKSL